MRNILVIIGEIFIKMTHKKIYYIALFNDRSHSKGFSSSEYYAPHYKLKDLNVKYFPYFYYLK